MPALGVVVSAERHDGAHPIDLVVEVGVDLGVRVGGEVDGDGGPGAVVPERAKERVVIVEAAELGSVLVVEVGEVGREGGCSKSVMARRAEV